MSGGFEHFERETCQVNLGYPFKFGFGVSRNYCIFLGVQFWFDPAKLFSTLSRGSVFSVLQSQQQVSPEESVQSSCVQGRAGSLGFRNLSGCPAVPE